MRFQAFDYEIFVHEALPNNQRPLSSTGFELLKENLSFIIKRIDFDSLVVFKTKNCHYLSKDQAERLNEWLDQTPSNIAVESMTPKEVRLKNTANGASITLVIACGISQFSTQNDAGEGAYTQAWNQTFGEPDEED
jgi:hypothetical protein